MDIATAIVGVIITYLTDGLPQLVTVDWDLFADQIQKVPATATDPAGPLPTFLTPYDNVHTWNNFLKSYTPPTVANVSVYETVSKLQLPVPSLLCLAALLLTAIWSWRRYRSSGPVLIPLVSGLLLLTAVVLLYPYGRFEVMRPAAMLKSLDQQEAQTILNSLLKNVYRAFDFREESDVYDKLAIFVSGDLLADLYLEQRKSLVVEQAGGAQAKVAKVGINQVTVQDSVRHPGAIDLRASWTALGTVGHWGHVHSRQNQYDAIVTIRAVAGSWKIIDLELLEEKRLF